MLFAQCTRHLLGNFMLTIICIEFCFKQGRLLIVPSKLNGSISIYLIILQDLSILFGTYNSGASLLSVFLSSLPFTTGCDCDNSSASLLSVFLTSLHFTTGCDCDTSGFEELLEVNPDCSFFSCFLLFFNSLCRRFFGLTILSRLFWLCLKFVSLNINYARKMMKDINYLSVQANDKIIRFPSNF